MELQLRSARPRFHPLTGPISRRRGMRGLADGTCQVPKPGVPMYYPACPGYETTAAAPAPSSSGPAPAPGVFVEPTAQAALNCVDPTSGLPYFSADCVNENLRREAANQAAHDAANRSVFVQNCNRDWQNNAAQYAALGMPVPPNDCEYRTYGQTLPGTTGGTTAYLPGTPETVTDWRSANPSGGVSVPWDDASAAKLATSSPAASAAPAGSAISTQAAPHAAGGSAPSTAPKTSGFVLPGGGSITELLSGSVDLGGNEIPTWALIAAAAVAAYFLLGGKK